MAAAGTSPALNLREKLAELAGLKQRVSPDLVRCDFGNLVTNGGFDTDIVGWTAFSNATLALNAGRLEVTSDAGFTIGCGSAPITTEVGKTYVLTVDTILGTSSSHQVWVGTDGTTASQHNSGNITSTTSYSATFVATATTHYVNLIANTDGGTSLFDNVSIHEADPSDDAPWLRLPYGYKVGQRGMIVRDGVVLHPSDYTEITDSGQTWIKPIVAPGVSTEFSIWAGA